MTVLRSQLNHLAKYCWHKFWLRNLYFLLLAVRSKYYTLPVYGRYSFYKNIFFFQRYIAPEKNLQEIADSPRCVRDMANNMSQPPGYVAIDYDKIKPISGVSLKYYEAGAFQLRDRISRPKIGIPLEADSDTTFWLPHSIDLRNTAFEKNHFKCCLGVRRVVGESFALHVFQLFECFLVLRSLQRQNCEVECLLLDSGRDKLSELYTTCLPGCHFPEDRKGIHLFNHLIFIQCRVGGGDQQSRKKFYTCDLAEEFHQFILSVFNIAPPEPVRQTKRITLIRRKQYIEVTNKPCIDRVIKNEEEIISALKAHYQNLEVQAVYFEELSITDQLNQFTKSDILVGMHGAGLIVGAYFTPPNAGILELFPKYFRIPQSSVTCRAVAASRKLHYRRWLNLRRANEFGTDTEASMGNRYYRNPVRYASLTQVPVAALIKRIDKLMQQIESPH